MKSNIELKDLDMLAQLDLLDQMETRWAQRNHWKAQQIAWIATVILGVAAMAISAWTKV